MRARLFGLFVAVAGMAGCVCPPGTERCDGECISMVEDRENCGVCGRSCVGDQVCRDGECSCPEGTRLCLGVCVDFARDPRHCGACGLACPAEASCVGGTCSCPGGWTACGLECAHLLSNTSHCGGCWAPCGPTESCVEGVCGCAPGESWCDGCVDLRTDPANCGACGNVCPAETSCADSTCRCPASTPMRCDTGCTDTATDAGNCGSCGRRCPATQICFGGACRCPSSGMLFCSGACRSVTSDPSHCGGCGRTCTEPMATCSSSSCHPDRLLTYTTTGGGYVMRSDDGVIAIDATGGVVAAWAVYGSHATVIRFGRDGAMVWSRTFSGARARPTAVVALDDGGALVGGTFETTWGTLVARGIVDGAIVRLDPMGVPMWTMQLSASVVGVDSLDVDADGSYVAGISFDGTMAFGATTHGPAAYGDVVVGRISAAGEPGASRRFGGGGTDGPMLVRVGSTGDLFVAGQTGAGIDLGGGSLDSVVSGFLGRLRADFSHVWSRRLSTDEVTGLDLAADDASIVAGAFERRATFGATMLTSAGQQDVFVAGFAPDGTPRWAEREGGNYDDVPAGVALDGSRVVVGGRTNSSIFEAGTFRLDTRSGGDGFLVFAGAMARPTWARLFGADLRDSVTGVAARGGRVAVIGRFEGTVDVGGGAVTEPGDRDVFVAIFQP